ASANDSSVELSRREVLILWLLKQREGKVVTRDALFDFCWGRDYLPSSRALDQQISVLRRKIEADPGNPRLIRTVHGEGYRYEGHRDG
ncbi:MAG: helix-turn-helix domain-containing protein, partial [Pseudomonadota bacterium]